MEVPDPVKRPKAKPPAQESSLFDTGQDHRLARRSDPQTSVDAIPTDTSKVRAALMEAYRTHGPMTAREAGNVLGHDGAWKRVSEMVRDGLLHDTGTTRVDPTTGRAGRVLSL